MADLFDLFLLLALAGAIGLWLKLSRAREDAIAEASRQCDQHGLQLLDETVGLRAIRLRRTAGTPVFERCYAFEVSVHGDDRQPGRIWMTGGELSGLSLPPGPGASAMATTVEDQGLPSNVIPLRRGNHSLH